jgi:5-methylcytosine-specific restriction endonuclease McrA
MKTCRRGHDYTENHRQCPVCRTETNRRFREANPGYGQRYSKENRDKINARDRARRAATSEERAAKRAKISPDELEKQRVYKRDHQRARRAREEVREQDRQRDKARRADPEARAAELIRARKLDAERRALPERREYSKEYQREYQRERRASDEEYRLKERQAGRRWRSQNREAIRAIKKNQRDRVTGRGVTEAEWQAICAPYADVDGRTQCAYCRDAVADTVDHVVPIAKGGRDEPENVLPACRRCNSSKSASLVFEWRRAPQLLDAEALRLLSDRTVAYLSTLQKSA